MNIKDNRKFRYIREDIDRHYNHQFKPFNFSERNTLALQKYVLELLNPSIPGVQPLSFKQIKEDFECIGLPFELLDSPMFDDYR